jgi:serine/threonine protein kinase
MRMTGSIRLKNPNELINKNATLFSILEDKINFYILYLLFKNKKLMFKQIQSYIPFEDQRLYEKIEILKKVGFLEQKKDIYHLTKISYNRIRNDLFSLDSLVGTSIAPQTNVDFPIHYEYSIKEKIGEGATSITFRGEQSILCVERTIKIFKPNHISYTQLSDAIRKRSKINHPSIPKIVDLGQIIIEFNGKQEILSCVVLDYIGGKVQTFKKYLAGKNNLPRSIFEKFIEDVGGALKAIEDVNLCHGDLHEGNVLIESEEQTSFANKFWVIDFIGVPSSTSPEIETISDIDNFRKFLLHAIFIASELYPGYSIRLLIGDKVFRILQNLRIGKYSTFSELLNDYNKPAIEIPMDFFKSPLPEPFEWLRVEQIPTHEKLYSLFEPLSSRFNKISRFGNTWISGPRGCGKSHYLRVLEFHPDVILKSRKDKKLKNFLTRLNYNFLKSFGILFACRLGEFKQFNPEIMKRTDDFDFDTQNYLKSILILKIWNKTLNTIKNGLEAVDEKGESILKIPDNFNLLIEFLERKIGSLGIIDDKDPISIFNQCYSMCIARENTAISGWQNVESRQNSTYLNEQDLDEFFFILKNTFPDLNKTQFFILVDDATHGNMHFAVQKILNSLIRATQSNHCFKITCEKFLYTLETMDNRPIDLGHEGTYVDMGEITVKSRTRQKIVEYRHFSEYMANVINRRLSDAGYTNSIQDILGKSQSSKEFLAGLTTKHSNKKGLVSYYAGWNIIWSISHGSVRTLLELIEHIFKVNKVNPSIKSIPLKDQDNAVRNFSIEHYKALSLSSGSIENKPIGPLLESVIRAIGQVSKQYLMNYKSLTVDEYYETISIERSDSLELDRNAEKILFELVRRGLLRDEGSNFSRAQFGLVRRYDLNKIFTPAFEITYRVRNHIHLRQRRFQKLLMDPDDFVKDYQKKFPTNNYQTGLFEYV